MGEVGNVGFKVNEHGILVIRCGNLLSFVSEVCSEFCVFLVIPTIHLFHLIFVSQLIIYHMTHMFVVMSSVVKHHFSFSLQGSSIAQL